MHDMKTVSVISGSSRAREDRGHLYSARLVWEECALFSLARELFAPFSPRRRATRFVLSALSSSAEWLHWAALEKKWRKSCRGADFEVIYEDRDCAQTCPCTLSLPLWCTAGSAPSRTSSRTGHRSTYLKMKWRVSPSALGTRSLELYLMSITHQKAES